MVSFSRTVRCLSPHCQFDQCLASWGFGNLTGKTATAGSAPYMSLTVDPTTNRTTTSGFQYDANGNLTNLPNVSGALSYDIENRTGSANSLYSNLAYDMENQPLDRGGQWNLYGLHGERLGTYTYTFGRDVTYINGVDYDTTPVYPAQATRNIYFGGRLIQSNGTTVVVDAQGSVRANESGQTFEFYPYGEEMGSGTANGREKFATYTRESNGLDYANQRYYSSTYGAFTSADPLHQTATTPADPNNPGSWNRFAYTAGDPINRIDPLGACLVASLDDSDDDVDVSEGSNCGGNGLLPSGSTRCHSLPGLIYTFNGVPSTCQDGIIVAVDTSHVAPPTWFLDVGYTITKAVNGVDYDHLFLWVQPSGASPGTSGSVVYDGGPAHSCALIATSCGNVTAWNSSLGHYNELLNPSMTLFYSVALGGFGPSSLASDFASLEASLGLPGGQYTYNPILGPNSNSVAYTLLADLRVNPGIQPYTVFGTTAGTFSLNGVAQVFTGWGQYLQAVE